MIQIVRPDRRAALKSIIATAKNSNELIRRLDELGDVPDSRFEDPYEPPSTMTTWASTSTSNIETMWIRMPQTAWGDPVSIMSVWPTGA